MGKKKVKKAVLGFTLQAKAAMETLKTEAQTAMKGEAPRYSSLPSSSLSQMDEDGRGSNGVHSHSPSNRYHATDSPLGESASNGVHLPSNRNSHLDHPEMEFLGSNAQFSIGDSDEENGYGIGLNDSLTMDNSLTGLPTGRSRWTGDDSEDHDASSRHSDAEAGEPSDTHGDQPYHKHQNSSEHTLTPLQGKQKPLHLATPEHGGLPHSDIAVEVETPNQPDESDGVQLLPSGHENSSGGHGHGHGIGNTKSSTVRALINILKAYVGSGVLGLPYAFAEGGMIAACIGMMSVSILSTICVFLLLDCKKRLGSRAKSFGDVGYGACGRVGHIMVECCVVLSQLGFCCAYLIFMAENLWTYIRELFPGEQSIIWLLVPALICLCWIRSMEVLAPFSLLSILLIFGGLFAVAFHSYDLLGHGPNVKLVVPQTLPIFVGMAIYAFEGIGLALPIENSMQNPTHFPWIWIGAMIVVTATYVIFGAFGYSCYGDQVPSIITLVLPDNAYALVVKLGLSMALLFTYPLAMYPVFEIVEESWGWKYLRQVPPGESSLQDGVSETDILWRRRWSRVALILVTTTAATAIPDFSVVMAFIGSVPSNIMVIPSQAAEHHSFGADSRPSSTNQLFPFPTGQLCCPRPSANSVSRSSAGPQLPNRSGICATKPVPLRAVLENDGFLRPITRRRIASHWSVGGVDLHVDNLIRS